MPFLPDIFKKVLENVQGIDLWIAVIGAVVCVIVWFWLGAKKRELKIFKRQIGAVFAVIVFAGLLIAGHHLFRHNKRFGPNVAGVIVLRIEGDTADNALQRRLVSTLDSEFAKNKSGERLEVWSVDDKVIEGSGLAKGHAYARQIGKDYNALLVVWGNTDTANRFFPRITLVESSQTYHVRSDRTLSVEDIREVNLSKEALSQTIFLSHFIAGWAFGARGQYESAIPQFDDAITLGDSSSEDMAYSKLLRAVARYLSSLGRQQFGKSFTFGLSDLRSAADIFDRRNDKEDWARCQLLMMFHWTELPTGNIIQNQKNAFQCYSNAASVFTKDRFPDGWATTQLALCELYSASITGYAADNWANQKLAVDRALEVFTETNNPRQWSLLQDFLGVTYLAEAEGYNPTSAKRAFDCFEKAISAVDCQENHELCIIEHLHLALAVAYGANSKNPKSYEEAIAKLEDTAKDCNLTNEAVFWAEAQADIAFFYTELESTNRDEDLNQAISHLQKAMTIRTREDLPNARVASLNLMASCYAELSNHSNANIKSALEAFKEATEIIDEASHPRLWAETQGSAGLLIMKLGVPDRTKALLAAKDCFRNALKVFKKDRFPHEYAKISANLAEVESELDYLQNAKK